MYISNNYLKHTLTHLPIQSVQHSPVQQKNQLLLHPQSVQQQQQQQTSPLQLVQDQHQSIQHSPVLQQKGQVFIN